MVLEMKFRDENDFIKKSRSLKKYCPRAYKDLVFNLDREELSTLPNGVYSKELYTSKEFELVYGKIKLVYSVVNRLVIMEDIEPSQFLLDGYVYELDTYRGMQYRNKRDKFKIDLMIRRRNENFIK